MFEQELGMTLIVFSVGVVLGVIVTLLINKMRSGSASPVTIKKEMEDYQDKVEAHFDETSNKFKQMTEQYQELYQHLSVGATSLCRPENIAPGLIAGAGPLDKQVALEKSPKTEKTVQSATVKGKDTDAAASASSAKVAQKASSPVKGKVDTQVSEKASATSSAAKKGADVKAAKTTQNLNADKAAKSGRSA